MYLPKSKYNVVAAKPGEFLLGTEQYTGPVVVTFRGEYFAGTAPDTVKGQLTKIESSDRKNAESVPMRRIPTEEEYTKGYMIRYFRQNLKTMKIEELLPKDYATDPERTSSKYSYGVCRWFLVGEIEDSQVLGKYRKIGVRNRNKEAIESLRKTISGIETQILTDPLEFVVESL